MKLISCFFAFSLMALEGIQGVQTAIVSTSASEALAIETRGRDTSSEALATLDARQRSCAASTLANGLDTTEFHGFILIIY